MSSAQSPTSITIKVGTLAAWWKRINALIDDIPESDEEQAHLAALYDRLWKIIEQGNLRLPVFSLWPGDPRSIDSKDVLSPFVDRNQLVAIEGDDAREFIDDLVRTTAIPPAMIAISGQTFDEWSRKLAALAQNETRGSIQRSPAGTAMNATSTLGLLQLAADDQIHTVEETQPGDPRPRSVMLAEGDIVELRDVTEESIRELIRNAEWLTTLKARYV
jgi:hypothetical protein